MGEFNGASPLAASATFLLLLSFFKEPEVEPWR